MNRTHEYRALPSGSASRSLDRALYATRTEKGLHTKRGQPDLPVVLSVGPSLSRRWFGRRKGSWLLVLLVPCNSEFISRDRKQKLSYANYCCLPYMGLYQVSMAKPVLQGTS